MSVALVVAAAGLAMPAAGPMLPDWPAVSDALAAAAAVLGWLALAYAGCRAVDLAMESQRLTRSAPTRLPQLLQDLAHVALYGLALLAILGWVFRTPLAGLVATSGVTLAVMGFALRNMIADVFAGIALNVERPYRIGDWIELAPGVVGRVVEINWRATRLATKDGTAIVVPNGVVAGSRFVNFSAPERHYRASLRFTLSPAVPVEQAKRVLLAAAAAPGILRDPPPQVMVEAVSEAGVVYVLRYWPPDYADDNPCRDAVMTAVVTGMACAGLTPAWPRRTLDRPDQPFQPDDDARRRALLGRVAVFALFSPAERAELARLLHEHFVPAGRVVVRQGEPGQSLFVIAEGVLDVEAAVDGRGAAPLDRMGPGAVFGEMSLLTGVARTASVVAATDAVVLEIDKDHLDPILRRRPLVAEQLAALMAQRQRGNLERKGRWAADADAQPLAATHDVLARLRAFFRLPH